MTDKFRRRHDPTGPAPHNPGGKPRDYTPEDTFFCPAIFDTRIDAWRIWNPSHPQANDPWTKLGPGRWPRQQALDSCNIIQLYEHLERLMADYQTRFAYFNDSKNIIVMPHQFIEPKAGWKLQDITTRAVYTVKSVLMAPNMEGKPTFDQRVVLVEAQGPPEGHRLGWLDPYGEKDGQAKIVKLMAGEDLNSLMPLNVSKGDVAESRGPFVPVVTYCLVRHEPGSLDRMPFGPHKQLKPIVRGDYRDPQDPRTWQRIWGWWMDTIVEFRCHAVGAKIANRLMVWLRNFFVGYTGVLKLLGVQQVLYWTTNRDVAENRSSYDLSIRPVQYYFRLEEIQVETMPTLGEVTVALAVLSSEDAFVTSDEFPTDTSGDDPLYGVLTIRS